VEAQTLRLPPRVRVTCAVLFAGGDGAVVADNAAALFDGNGPVSETPSRETVAMEGWAAG